jgi:hypothetical protein
LVLSDSILDLSKLCFLVWGNIVPTALAKINKNKISISSKNKTLKFLIHLKIKLLAIFIEPLLNFVKSFGNNHF